MFFRRWRGKTRYTRYGVLWWVLGLVCSALVSVPGLAATSEYSSDMLWDALKKGGHIALIRHAIAPGTGDPPHFQLGDCTTQRNLSEEGRQQARRIGQEFRARDIQISRVLSSRWCRCLETAELLDLGLVEPFPALDSFFRHRDREAEQTAAVRRFIGQIRPQDPSVVMVTHQVNITALTGIFPRSGEIVVIRPVGPEQFEVLGHIPSL